MKFGARNTIKARVTSIQSDKVMSLVKLDVDQPMKLASVITTESVSDMGLKVGDEVSLIIKAVHVLPIKE